MLGPILDRAHFVGVVSRPIVRRWLAALPTVHSGAYSRLQAWEFRPYALLHELPDFLAPLPDMAALAADAMRLACSGIECCPAPRTGDGLLSFEHGR